jgi:TetR/AcrR family transcriptional repressor of mexJK operon
MGLQEPAKTKKDVRREAILKVAREVFLEHGYSGASMSQIAERVGGSKATLYNHFFSKNELFVAVAEEEVNQRLKPLFDVSEMSGDISTVLEKFVQRILILLLSDEIIAFYRLVVAEAKRFPEVGQTAYEIGVKRGIELMEGYFSEAVARGELRQANVSVMTEQFMDLCDGHLHRRRLWGITDKVSQEDIDAQARRITATFLATFGNDELSRAARQSTYL